MRHEPGIDLEVDELAGLVHVEKGRLVEKAVKRGVLIRKQVDEVRRRGWFPSNRQSRP